MSKNLLTASQREISTIVHNDDSCTESHCYPCREFRLAVAKSGLIVVERGIEIVLEQRDDKVVFNSTYFYAFCDHCQDGVNERFEPSVEWIVSHVEKRHSH